MVSAILLMLAVLVVGVPSFAWGQGNGMNAPSRSAFMPEPVAGGERPTDLTVWTLSTRPEYVTGGDVLVRVDVPRNMPLESVGVSVDGRDVSDSFELEGRTLTGLVTGLQIGSNSLEVTGGRTNQRQALQVELVNHSLVGPLFSGPKQTPFICETEENGLGAPLDADCSASTVVTWYAGDEGGDFAAFDPSSGVPSDVAQITTLDGRTVDYVVRVESGTINRAVYRIATLADPSSDDVNPIAAGWNGKLQYRFGGGCGPGYHQGTGRDRAVLDHDALSRGYATATSTLNVYGTACDDVLSAETALMVKEHFIESYGLPIYTMGQGGSGGGMQQVLIAQNYPGILDGITPARLFPDGTSLWHTETDCRLLRPYFESTDMEWTDSERLAVEGFGTLTCGPWDRGDGNIDQTVGCDSVIPDELIFDPVSNPDGARCSLYDSMGNLFGRNPETGAAWRPLDNVGLQYGLDAFASGAISFGQFADLNASVGGYDDIGRIVDTRTVADPIGLENAYRGGRIFSGEGVHLPIIDLRYWGDGTNDVHDSFRSHSFRERLERANGHSDNQVTIVGGLRRGADIRAQLEGMMIDVMDEWLENLLRDPSARPYEQRVIAAKPAGFVSGCYTDPGGEFIADPLVTQSDEGPCGSIYPPHGNPRTAAGAPITEDVAKCVLKPVDPTDYRELPNAQLTRLQEIFPEGVCDFSQPGIGQEQQPSPWQVYEDGPVG